MKEKNWGWKEGCSFFIVLFLAIIGNYCDLPLLFGVNFIFGSAFIIIAVLFFRLPAVIIIALLASSVTFYLWGHIYAIIIFLAEAIYLFYVLRVRQKIKNIVIADFSFWLLLGAPLAFIFYHYVLELDWWVSVMIALKQTVNGVFNAMIASLIFISMRFINLKYFEEKNNAPEMGEIMFSLILFTITLFGSLPILYAAHNINKVSESEIKERLLSDYALVTKSFSSVTGSMHTINKKLQQLSDLSKGSRVHISNRNGQDFSNLAQTNSQQTGVTKNTKISGLLVWLPEGNMSEMKRWSTGRYLIKKAIKHNNDDYVVEISQPAKDNVNKLSQSRLPLLALLLGVLILGSIVSQLLKIIFSYPVIALDKASSLIPLKVSQGVSPKLPNFFMAEYISLKETLNNMAKQLIDAFNQLNTIQLNLENQVKDKTRTIEINRKRLELALSASRMGVWEYDIQTKTLIWDDMMFTLYGVKKEDFSGAYEAWEAALLPEDKDKAVAILEESIEKSTKFDTSFRIILPNKKIRIIGALADVVFENNLSKKMIGVNVDITELKDREAQLEYLAKYDNLSQLKNRFSFNENCEQLIKRAFQNGKSFALLLIDIDDFKQVNDLYGHQVGDQYIRLLSDTIEDVCRQRSSVYRLGGDEFAVLSDFFEDDSVPGDIGERINLNLQKPFNINGHKIQGSCSIGIAVFPHAGSHADELMTNADIALYKSKNEGKDSINYFTDSLNEKAKRLRFINKNLISAAKSGEFFMNYQPIVDAQTNKTVAVEALARWGASIGFISPSEFIPVAEQSSAINELGDVIVRNVVRDIAEQEQRLKVTINCSSKQFTQNSGFSTVLFDLLEHHKILPQNVILEVTESYLIRDYDEINKALHIINNKGVEVAIDDFGTGYSSLSLLANIPFQYLKIDRAFIANIDRPDDFKVLQCIFNVAQGLDKKIIAEGVESKEQRDKLLKMGITLMQGFYFSKAENIKDIPMEF